MTKSKSPLALVIGDSTVPVGAVLSRVDVA